MFYFLRSLKILLNDRDNSPHSSLLNNTFYARKANKMENYQKTEKTEKL